MQQPAGPTMTAENMATKPTLVLGGTGKAGRRIVERLAVWPLRDRRRQPPRLSLVKE
jgi:hypothetical protein